MTKGKIELDDYGKNTLTGVMKKADVICTLPYRFTKYCLAEKTLKSLVNDMMELYFTENKDIFNHWEGFFKCFCEGMATHDEDEKKRADIARKKYLAAKRKLKKAQGESATSDNSLRISSTGQAVSWDNTTDNTPDNAPTRLTTASANRCAICGGIHD